MHLKINFFNNVYKKLKNVFALLFTDANNAIILSWKPVFDLAQFTT